MICNTFLLLKGMGKRKEQQLWKSGIKEWNDFLAVSSVRGVSGIAKRQFDHQLHEAKARLLAGDSTYFAERVPSAEHWRCYDDWSNECCFLDIETASQGRQITVVGISDGYSYKTLVRKANLYPELLKQELARYKMIVTFNGSSFDLPHLEKWSKGIVPKIPHFDLKHGCARLGYTGGLKEVEKQLGVVRAELVSRVKGGDPRLLWKTFLATGDQHYLDLLLAYNEEDVMNLKRIAEKVYHTLKEKLLG
ncbi:ribonuclease H-like domain-containing protein [Candidatus Woesearchaeota archaeon]|nr:ribonuclease H-like domain-containing protein [Candidatus Woesearchaeota archaeon]